MCNSHVLRVVVASTCRDVHYLFRCSKDLHVKVTLPSQVETGRVDSKEWCKHRTLLYTVADLGWVAPSQKCASKDIITLPATMRARKLLQLNNNLCSCQHTAIHPQKLLQTTARTHIHTCRTTVQHTEPWHVSNVKKPWMLGRLSSTSQGHL